jgi:hypothetical protein
VSFRKIQGTNGCIGGWISALCFKSVVDTSPQVGRALSVRLWREGERLRQHHELKGGRIVGLPTCGSAA